MSRVGGVGTGRAPGAARTSVRAAAAAAAVRPPPLSRGPSIGRPPDAV